ncbi:hypothetical protein ACOMCU_25450 [Lysinibacillus sp. UGB7]|uniref:hypothetical protein n=1 Tax=Lysinibacillus sp. UGB7 TaxID=3411039 RepID=UPI003B760518
MENRKLVSWRLEKLEKNQQATINAWLDAQPNIQLSITNVVQHMIDRFGITDIMNYDVQKALYTNPDATLTEKLVKKDIKTVESEEEIIPPSIKEDVKPTAGNNTDLYDDLSGNL